MTSKLPRGLLSSISSCSSKVSAGGLSAAVLRPHLRPYPRLPRTLQPLNAARRKHSIPKPPQSRPQPQPLTSSDSSNDKTPTAPAQEKTRKQREPHYQLTFTCVPCSSRTTHEVSKQGYHHGSVLITCPSCRNRHIISDHLGIFGDRKITIEDIMRERGRLVKRGTLGVDGDIEFWEDDETSSREGSTADEARQEIEGLRGEEEASQLRQTKAQSAQPATNTTPTPLGTGGARPSVDSTSHPDSVPSTRREYSSIGNSSYDDYDDATIWSRDPIHQDFDFEEQPLDPNTPRSFVPIPKLKGKQPLAPSMWDQKPLGIGSPALYRPEPMDTKAKPSEDVEVRENPQITIRPLPLGVVSSTARPFKVPKHLFGKTPVTRLVEPKGPRIHKIVHGPPTRKQLQQLREKAAMYHGWTNKPREVVLPNESYAQGQAKGAKSPIARLAYLEARGYQLARIAPDADPSGDFRVFKKVGIKPTEPDITYEATYGHLDRYKRLESGDEPLSRMSNTMPRVPAPREISRRSQILANYIQRAAAPPGPFPSDGAPLGPLVRKVKDKLPEPPTREDVPPWERREVFGPNVEDNPRAFKLYKYSTNLKRDVADVWGDEVLSARLRRMIDLGLKPNDSWDEEEDGDDDGHGAKNDNGT
ncbi:hypothetical protein SLS62_005312 [Diatrype stigma]|uniref:DNL-type domain-containing protein n=1 Tax=Diatrype stigma TaxID=117547 RepID=A0AAN9UPX2_9PEZI